MYPKLRVWEHAEAIYVDLNEKYSLGSIFQLPDNLCHYVHAIWGIVTAMLYVAIETYMSNWVKFDRLSGLTFFKMYFFLDEIKKKIILFVKWELFLIKTIVFNVNFQFLSNFKTSLNVNKQDSVGYIQIKHLESI